jgi:outer membrane protein TolC
MRKISVIFALVAAFFLSGCATMKTPSKPGDVWTPPKWEKASKKPDTYWKEIRERKSIPGPVGLGEIVEAALENNPSTSKAIATARAAQAKVKQSESTWYPQVTVEADVTRYRRTDEYDVNEMNQLYATPQGSLTMLLFDFGGRAARVKEAMNNLVAANFSYNQTVLDVILTAQKAYYSYYSAMAQLDASEDDVNDSKTTYYAADQKYRAGIVTMLDVLQSKSTFENALYTREQRRGDLKTAQGTLAQSMGLSADTSMRIEIPGARTPPDVTKQNIKQVIDYALEKRPDIASQRASVNAKASALAAANSDLFPTLNLGGSLDSNYYDYYGVQQNEAALDKYNSAFTGFVNVKWNIFDGFYNYSKRNEAKALLKAQEETLLKAEIDASSDVWNRFYSYKTSVSKLTSSEALFKSSKKSYELAKESYDAGLKNIIDLLRSQSDLSAARSKLISSRVDVFTSLADLAHAVGLMSTSVEENSTPKNDQAESTRP